MGVGQDELLDAYQALQEQYDKLVPSEDAMPTDPESRERIRQIQNEMALTVDNIEKKKKRYLQIQSRYKKQKERLEVLEEELIDGRAELVATSGILEQNENIRNKIQEE